MIKTIAVTGGTGFVGDRLLDIAALHKYHVRALTRRDQPPRAGVTWVRGSLEDPAGLLELVTGADAVIHVAGVISAPTRAGFEAGNVTGTLNMVEAAKAAGVRRFVHISSLAAREPDLSDYGWSKARAESFVKASGLDWTIVRPPAVYGPGDKETLELFKMAKRGLILLPPRGRLSLIEVGDLAAMIVATLPWEDCVAQTYEPDDGQKDGWDHRHFARLLGDAFGRKARPLPVPGALMKSASLLDRLVRRSGAKLTADRVRYFLHPDWVVAAAARPPIQLWRPRVRTPQGLKATADWYRAKGWIR
jgi:nucleoside-diphosphate-sugar epimerase